MTEKEPASQIATLGRLCGITSGYRDNQGKRHRTSQATYKALLTAMGVPWQEPGVLQKEIEQRRSRLTDRLLQPVSVVSGSAPPNPLVILARTPGPEPEQHLAAAAELTGESGQKWNWECRLGTPVHPESYPVAGAFRHRFELPLPEELEPGYYDLKLWVRSKHGEETGSTLLVAAPETAYQPPCLAAGQRLWGFNLPLYALTSSHNWGIGDFSDLREITRWAGQLGAAFVGVNPLHALAPEATADPSPYSPTSRLFVNFLYLDLERVPEFEESPEIQALVASPEFQTAKTQLRESELVNYSEVNLLKRKILKPLFKAFCKLHHAERPRTPRGEKFRHFVQESGEILQKFAEFSALADHWGENDWRRWPPEYQHPDSQAVAAFSHEHRQAVLFHAYVQWLAATQLDRVKQQARHAGLPFTLYQDLALGTIPGGFETWAYPGLFAQGVAIGAPPDAFNPKGQDWGLPPMIPEHLSELRFQPFINTLRANLPQDGMLRLDHVMALFRLFWIPKTAKRTAGAYVRYPARELLAILALESKRRRTLIIGEDLGTVAPQIRRELKRIGIFSYRVFYFERNPNREFQEPENYPRQATAAVTTHDLPTLAGYWQGRDLDIKQRLHLYPEERMADIDARGRAQDRQKLGAALSRRSLLPEILSVKPPQDQSCPEEVRLGVLEYLGQSAAALLEIRLEEVFGLTEQQNMPGTTREYPNWRRKIPLSLSQMQEAQEPVAVAKRLSRSGRGLKPPG